jgi:ribosome-binding protein aMBF1 (putative translation factor)
MLYRYLQQTTFKWIIVTEPMRTVDLLMEEFQLTVEDLAEKSTLAPARVDAIASGRWTPNPVEREKIASSFQLQVTDIAWGHTMDPRNIRYRRFGLKEDF